ncbi:hypothetical protein DOY81_003746 [Sarcophaga bullata]|nr:hypothetical protein DOY81_003746 [Sarcophaga bullata]
MKSCALVVIALCLAIIVQADDTQVGSPYNGGNNAGYGNYGGGSPGTPPGPPVPEPIPAPPCPKNYLFSCQPSLQPAPCSQAVPANFGGAGAYSQNYPVYALQVPQYINGYQFH